MSIAFFFLARLVSCLFVKTLKVIYNRIEDYLNLGIKGYLSSLLEDEDKAVSLTLIFGYLLIILTIASFFIDSPHFKDLVSEFSPQLITIFAGLYAFLYHQRKNAREMEDKEKRDLLWNLVGLQSNAFNGADSIWKARVIFYKLIVLGFENKILEKCAILIYKLISNDAYSLEVNSELIKVFQEVDNGKKDGRNRGGNPRLIDFCLKYIDSLIFTHNQKSSIYFIKLYVEKRTKDNDLEAWNEIKYIKDIRAVRNLRNADNLNDGDWLFFWADYTLQDNDQLVGIARVCNGYECISFYHIPCGFDGQGERIGEGIMFAEILKGYESLSDELYNLDLDLSNSGLDSSNLGGLHDEIFKKSSRRIDTLPNKLGDKDKLGFTKDGKYTYHGLVLSILMSNKAQDILFLKEN